MSKCTFKPRRATMLARRLAGIREVLADFDPFENWHRNRMPELEIAEDLRAALFLLYAKHSGPEIKAFLKRTIEPADRALSEKKCESKLCRGSFPLNRGQVLRLHAYARSLLRGARLDLKALAQASRDFEVWCRETDAEDWDEISQPYLLAAIRMELICGDLDRADYLLRSRRCTSKQKKEQDMWQAVVKAQREGGPPLADKTLMAKFDSIFDRNRNPYEPEEIAALELGLLRDRYFGSGGKGICWTRIIDAISR